MKNILTIVVLLFFGISCQAQPTTNELTEEQFNNIRVNGILKTDVEATNGTIQEMESLFGVAHSVTDNGEEIGEHTRKFVYLNNNLNEDYFIFKNLSPNNSVKIIEFKISSITINGITINIGDNINLLGNNILFNERTDGTMSIIYSLFDYDGFSIVIEFDQNTNIITKIEYYVWT